MSELVVRDAVLARCWEILAMRQIHSLANCVLNKILIVRRNYLRRVHSNKVRLCIVTRARVSSGITWHSVRSVTLRDLITNVHVFIINWVVIARA